jgi:hypothetical protein
MDGILGEDGRAALRFAPTAHFMPRPVTTRKFLDRGRHLDA